MHFGVTVVAQWAKAPGIHCYVAGSIPAVIPRYCKKKIEKCSLEHKKTKEKKTLHFGYQLMSPHCEPIEKFFQPNTILLRHKSGM